MVSITRELLPKHLHLCRLRKRRKHAHYPKRESLCPIAQILLKARPLLRIGEPGHCCESVTGKPGLASSCVTGYGFLLHSSFHFTLRALAAR